MKRFAAFLSFLFNPVIFLLIMPYIFVYRQTENSLYAIKWGLFSSLFIIIGVFFIFLGKWRGMYSDFDLSQREEREKFYAIALLLSICYFGAALFFKGIVFPLSIVGLGIVLGVVAFSVVNLFVKASLHVGIACAFVITISILLKSSDVFIFSIWIIPLVIWARLVLKRHTLKEVVAGGFLGSIITLVTFFLGRFIYH